MGAYHILGVNSQNEVTSNQSLFSLATDLNPDSMRRLFFNDYVQVFLGVNCWENGVAKTRWKPHISREVCTRFSKFCSLSVWQFFHNIHENPGILIKFANTGWYNLIILATRWHPNQTTGWSTVHWYFLGNILLTFTVHFLPRPYLVKNLWRKILTLNNWVPHLSW